jgi:transposase
MGSCTTEGCCLDNFSNSMNERHRRRHSAYLMLRRGMRPAQIARKLGVSCQSVCRWRDTIKKGGYEHFTAAVKRGRKTKLSAKQCSRLLDNLVQTPESLGLRLPRGARHKGWTLALIKRLIKKYFGVTYSISGVWNILRRDGFNIMNYADINYLASEVRDFVPMKRR